MVKTYNLKVNQNDLIILRTAIEKIQIFGKDAPAVADIYMRINDLYAKAEEDRVIPPPPQQ
jgi:hypothetical protein